MITCEHLVGFLTDYIENTLSPDERARFDKHLTLCPECVDYLYNFKTTLHACQCSREHVSANDAPSIPENLVQAILAARPKS